DRNYVRLFSRPLWPVPPGKLPFCHANEVAKAHIAAAERGQGTYMLGEPYHSWLEVMQRIAKLRHLGPPKRCASQWLLHSLTWVSSEITPDLVRLMSIQGDFPAAEALKTRRELGYCPPSLEKI